MLQQYCAVTDILHLFENKFDTFDTSPSMEIKKNNEYY